MPALSISRRYNGPPASGNGGWVGGLLAERLGAASAQVTLRTPPPLDVPLQVRAHGGGIALHDGDTLLAEAIAHDFDLEVPPAPSLESAAAAGALGRIRAFARTGNPYRHCFGCGIERDDGLRIVPSPVGDDGDVVATDWTPAAEFARIDGLLPAPVVWAALDCPAGVAWTHRLPDAPPMMTGRIAVRIDAPIRAGRRYVAMGWPISQEGRKLHAGTAIVGADGTVHARSLQLWLLPKA